MNTLEIIGLLLIISGIVYTFLRGLGKLSDTEDAELESKILKIKGGPGLIFIALGIILFSIGFSQSFQLALPKNPQDEPSTSPILTAKETQIPIDKLIIGEWIRTTDTTNDNLFFYENGTFESFNTFFSGEESFSHSSGDYQIVNSELIIYYRSGRRSGNELTLTLTFIDNNKFELDGMVYNRVAK